MEKLYSLFFLLQVAAMPLIAQVPSAPSSFVANPTGTDRINLTWRDNSSNESGFRIYRSAQENGTYTVVHTTAANIRDYTNTGLTLNTNYYYKIAAYNSSGESAQIGPIYSRTLPPNGAIHPWVYTPRLTWAAYNNGGVQSKPGTSDFVPFIYNGLPFRLMYPNNYDSTDTDTKWPIILMMHGAGEYGVRTDNEWSLRHGGLNERNAVLSGKFPGFVIHFQNLDGDWTYSHMPSMINTLEILSRELGVDLNRISIHGLSDGAYFIWRFIEQYPTYFASAIPMSGTGVYANNYVQKIKEIPLWVSNGGLDTNPEPGSVYNVVNTYRNAGANVKHSFYENLGHGVWNNHYNEPGFFEFMLAAKKQNPLVHYGRTEFCPEESFIVTMSLSPGFDAYEWQKDGAFYSTQRQITTSDYGIFRSRIRRGNQWSDWSDPVQIKIKDVTQTPPIEVEGTRSNFLPDLSNNNTVPLTLPDGYSNYQWRNADNHQIIGTQRTVNVGIGNYYAIVTEENGCSSIPSDVFVVKSSSGNNLPELPANPRTVALSETQIRLSWDDKPSPSFNEDGYEIYRSLNPETDFSLIYITGQDESTYIDSNLVANTFYYYKLRAINQNGTSSASEVFVGLTLVDDVAPSTPQNLEVTYTTSNSISLQWDSSVDNVKVAVYRIYINNQHAITTTETSTTIYNLTARTVYNCTVKAFDETGNESSMSNQVTTATVVRGIKYDYYEGTWDLLPDFNALVPVKSGYIETFHINSREKDDYFAFKFEGMINISTAGNYTFYTTSDDGSKLYIGGHNESDLIVNNDGLHGNVEKSGTKYLTVGNHPIVVTYFEKTGGQTLTVQYSGPGITKRAIPASVLKEDFEMPGTPPAYPTNLVATAVSYKQINLSWQDNSSNETGFQIYRAENTLGPYENIFTTEPNVTTFEDKGLQPNKRYFYKIESIGTYGESGFADEVEKGLAYEYYETGSLTSLPNFDLLTPVTTGETNNFNIGLRQRNDYFAFRFSGFIEVQVGGVYTFYTRSDEGSKLYIGAFDENNLVVNNDGIHTARERSGSITLDAGVYPIYVTYFDRTSSQTLEVRYAGPGISKRLIPDEVLRGFEVSAQTFTLPSAPVASAELLASGISVGQIQLTWKDKSDNESGFRIYRSLISNNNFDEVTTIAASDSIDQILSFVDENLFAHTSYYYKVVSYNDGGTTESVIVSGATLNTPPVISEIGEKLAKFDVDTFIELYAEDADGDSIFFTSPNLPSFATLVNHGDGSGKIVAHPTSVNAGVYPDIIVIANDSYLGRDTVTFELYVSQNSAPSLTAIDTVRMIEKDELMLEIYASDPDGDELLWSIEGLPDFVTMSQTSDTSATLNLKPGYADAGSYTGSIIVDDQNRGITLSSFEIIVEDKELPSDFTVYVNLCPPGWEQAAPWNNTSFTPADGLTLTNLKDALAVNTGINFTLESNWNTASSGDLGQWNGIYPRNVLKSYYFSGNNNPNIVKIDGLDPDFKYDFEFFGSRAADGVRIANFSIGEQTVSLETALNSFNTVTIPSVAPGGNGEVFISVSKGPGTSYYYWNALVIHGKFDDGSTPAVPDNIAAVFGQSGLVLNWRDRAYNEDGYRIYKSLSMDSPFVLIAETAANSTSYVDNDVAGNETYFYKIMAYNGHGPSAFSNIITVQVPNTPPVIVPIDDVVVNTLNIVNIDIAASDNEGDNITLTFDNLPNFASFNTISNGIGRLVIAPGPNDAGNYNNIVLRASDGTGVSLDSFNILVVPTGDNKIFVNFNHESSNAEVAPWNNTSFSPATGQTITNLLDRFGTGTNVNISITSAWNGNYGVNTSIQSAQIPNNVIRSFFWLNKNAVGTFKVEGLDVDYLYDFTFWGSREGTGDRTTVYTINGRSVNLNAANNTTQSVTIEGVSPTANGEIVFSMVSGPASSYAYLNALIIDFYPKTSIRKIDNIVANGISDSQIKLTWQDKASDETGFDVLRSSSENGQYLVIASLPANSESYIDNGLSENTRYYYKIKANGNEEYTSEPVTGTTLLFSIWININDNYLAPSPWINTARAQQLGDTYVLKDSKGRNTGMELVLTKEFTGDNPWGTITGNNSGVYPDAVMNGSYWLDPGASGQFKVTGLNLLLEYNFTFFGSRDGTGNRFTNYSIGDKTVTLNASKNTSETVSINKVRPNEFGEIFIDVATASGSVYGYINSLIIDSYQSNYSNGRLYFKNNSLVQEELRDLSSNIIVYPNPFKEAITLELHNLLYTGELNVILFDQTGRAISSKYFPNESDILKLDYSDLGIKDGIYILKIYNNNFNRTIKLLKNSF